MKKVKYSYLVKVTNIMVRIKERKSFPAILEVYKEEFMIANKMRMQES